MNHLASRNVELVASDKRGSKCVRRQSLFQKLHATRIARRDIRRIADRLAVRREPTESGAADAPLAAEEHAVAAVADRESASDRCHCLKRTDVALAYADGPRQIRVVVPADVPDVLAPEQVKYRRKLRTGAMRIVVLQRLVRKQDKCPCRCLLNYAAKPGKLLRSVEDSCMVRVLRLPHVVAVESRKADAAFFERPV